MMNQVVDNGPLTAFLSVMEKMRKEAKKREKVIYANIEDTKNEIKVICGNLNGQLHLDRFYCPGISSHCIKLGDDFVTPKNFTIIAGRDRQKDWRGCIRSNGRTIRYLMEHNQLGFASHDEHCSRKCQRRGK